MEACDESVAGVGQAICEKAEELGAAVVRRRCKCTSGMRMPRAARVPAGGSGSRRAGPLHLLLLFDGCSLDPALPLQVVLGSHMSGGLMEFMLGSVATHVAHHCSRPVAVLH